MKKMSIFAFALVLAIAMISFASADTYIDSCMTLDTPGTYILNQSITGITGTCFTITADDVVLDGNGYTIDGNDLGTDYGIITISGYQNITIKNFVNISDFTYGIVFDTVNSSSITNTSTFSNGGSGVQLSSSNHNQLSNLVFTSNGIGIEMITSSNNSISNYTTYSSTTGLYLSVSSNNNRVFNFVSNSLTYGLLFESSANNNVLTNVVVTSELFVVNSDSSSNNTLLNASYNDESVSSGSLTRKWYVDVSVKNDKGKRPLSDYLISAYDGLGVLSFFALTGNSGKISRQEVTEYVNNDGTRTYYNDYTLSLSRAKGDGKVITQNLIVDGNEKAVFVV